MSKNRRNFLKTFATGLLSFPFLKGVRANYRPRIVIIGGGFGGGTCVKYLEKYNNLFKIILIEKSKNYYTCPFSNYVIGGFRKLEQNKFNYKKIQRRGTEVITKKVSFIDSEKKTIKFSDKESIKYDWLIISTGVGYKWNEIEGYDQSVNKYLPHAWSGIESQKIFDKVNKLTDNSKILISAPDYPYRCPPAPYERASLIANHLKKKGLKFKIIILDNKDSFTKQELFLNAWKKLYPSQIEWIPRSKGGEIVKLNHKDKIVYTKSNEKIKADLINIIPNQKASDIFFTSNLIDNEWCEVNPTTFQLKSNKFIHVIGDSINAWDMPKSAFSANSQGKVCSENIKNIILEKEILDPVFLNTCYSMAAENYTFSISAWYRVNSENNRIVSLGHTQSNLNSNYLEPKKETQESYAWYKHITDEIFG